MSISTRLLKLPEVLDRVKLSRPQLYKMIRCGDFPRQIKISERSSAWDEREIDCWSAEKIAARDAAGVAGRENAPSKTGRGWEGSSSWRARVDLHYTALPIALPHRAMSSVFGLPDIVERFRSARPAR